MNTDLEDEIMDMKRIGMFLASLRKEQEMTQEQLGDKLGVTNKTISRWETGTYMPPVEMLQMLSEMYHVSINEILSGERLEQVAYQEKAEENLKQILSKSSFNLQERISFFRKKWIKENIFELILVAVCMIGLIIAGCILDNGLQVAGVIGLFAGYVVEYNRMMTFVEKFAYNGEG